MHVTDQQLASSQATVLVLRHVQGLQLYDSLIIVPCMQLCFTLFGVVSGLLYFQVYNGMSQLQTAMFVLGVAVVCLGAGALARASQGGSAAAARHSHTDQEAAEPNCGLKPMPESFYRDIHRAAPAGGSDFRLQVAWQQGTGLTMDSMAAASDKGEQGTSGRREATVTLWPHVALHGCCMRHTVNGMSISVSGSANQCVAA
jgi:hypothetical protein